MEVEHYKDWGCGCGRVYSYAGHEDPAGHGPDCLFQIRLFHGGVPGLKPGDLLEGGHDRKFHAGCAICLARANGGPEATEHPHEVYVTISKDYARLHASLYGLGDLYRVELLPGQSITRSDEDDVPTWRSPAVRVGGIVERAVRLTMKDRRRNWKRARQAW